MQLAQTRSSIRVIRLSAQANRFPRPLQFSLSAHGRTVLGPMASPFKCLGIAIYTPLSVTQRAGVILTQAS